MAVPARTLSDWSLGALTLVGLVVACLSEEAPRHADAGTLGATGAPSTAQTSGSATSAEETVAVGSTEGDASAAREAKQQREASNQRWD